MAYLPPLKTVKTLDKSIAEGGGRFSTTNFENIRNLESNPVKRKAGILVRKDYYVILHNNDCETRDDLECNIVALLQHDNYQLDYKQGAPSAIISFQSETLRANAYKALQQSTVFDPHISHHKPSVLAAFKNFHKVLVTQLQGLVNTRLVTLSGREHLLVIQIGFVDQCRNHTQVLIKHVVPHNNIRDPKTSLLYPAATEPKLLGAWFGPESKFGQYFNIYYDQIIALWHKKWYLLRNCPKIELAPKYWQSDHSGIGGFTHTKQKDPYAATTQNDRVTVLYVDPRSIHFDFYYIPYIWERANDLEYEFKQTWKEVNGVEPSAGAKKLFYERVIKVLYPNVPTGKQ